MRTDGLGRRTRWSAQRDFTSGPERTVASALLGLLLLLGAAGCPGSLEDPDRFLQGDGGGGGGGACGDVPARIFVPSCGGTGCHGATSPQLGLDLTSPGVAARVLGVRAVGCVGVLADPRDAARSVLYSKLLSAPPCGTRMPLARPPLSDEDTACVKAWIEAQVPVAPDGGM